MAKTKNRLKVLRAEREITQLDLALKSGLTRERYWFIENGYRRPSGEERARLARALRVDEAELGFPAQEPAGAGKAAGV